MRRERCEERLVAPERSTRDRAIVATLVLLGLSTLAMACGGEAERREDDDTCSEARDIAETIKEAAEVDGIDSNGICSLTDEEINAVIDAAPLVPPDEKADRAVQYHKACESYREVAENCDDLGADGDVG